MDNNYLKHLETINYSKALNAISNSIWCSYNSIRGETLPINERMVYGSGNLYAVAYTLLKIAQNSNLENVDFDTFKTITNISESRALFLYETVVPMWNSLPELVGKFSQDELTALILFNDGSNHMNDDDLYTPNCICNLATAILDPKPSDYVADFATGKGTFIRQAFMNGYNVHYYGNDLKYSNVEIARMRAEILGINADIEIEDIFQLTDQVDDTKFNALFMNAPWGIYNRYSRFDYSSFITKTERQVPDLVKSGLMDWLFNYVAATHIADDGRAVCIMSNGSMWNAADRGARKFFVEQGLVEAIIALPDKLYDATMIPVSMVVLSHGNESIRMIDGRSICETGRRNNTLTADHITQIKYLLSNNERESAMINLESIREHNYDLYPARYLEINKPIKYGAQFGQVIKSVTRGAGLSANALDEMISKEPTDIQYLMLKNINAGVIDGDLPYLKSIDSRLEKYCLKNRCLILSKNGAPFKVAVAEIGTNQRVLGNGNLFIIELDEAKVDPYFLKAFFESDLGMAALKSISVGTSMPNISLEALRNLEVPVPPIEDQLAFAAKYQAATDNVKYLKSKVEQAVSAKNHLFDEFLEGGE